ncbi:glycosyltransferase family 1 protein [Paenibacillus qinlingensis]|nr:glycosyltransferase family 1 protein [Paenibacillus qinlingensis]
MAKRRGDGHISQIITGFMMLHDQKIIDLQINETAEFPFVSIVEVVINNEIRVLYDMADGYTFHLEHVEDYAERADFYFKRSYNQNYHQQYAFASRMYPLGLNYHVTMKNNRLDKPTEDNLLAKLKWYIKERQGRNYHQQFYVDKFEDFPRAVSAEPRILFATRTWSFEEEDLNSEETQYIDDMRAECIRRLRKQFGSNFIGGFSKREFARKHYPDCLLDESVTVRTNFMRLVKEADICLSTMGLFESNGWKLAEYVAASKAIVSERLRYTVPDFVPNKHYLAFTSVDECLEQTVKLASNKELMLQMKKNNHDYYQQYLRPDKLILRSLLTMQVV